MHVMMRFCVLLNLQIVVELGSPLSMLSSQAQIAALQNVFFVIFKTHDDSY